MNITDKINSELRQALIKAFQLTGESYASEQLEAEHVLYIILSENCPSFVRNKEAIIHKLIESMQNYSKKFVSKHKAEVISNKLAVYLNTAIEHASTKFSKNLLTPDMFVYVLSKTLTDVAIDIDEKQAVSHFNMETSNSLSFLSKSSNLLYISGLSSLITTGSFLSFNLSSKFFSFSFIMSYTKTSNKEII